MDIKNILEEVGSIDRYPILKIEKVGQTEEVKFLDEGKFVSAETIQTALKEKHIKGIKARDSIVFLVEHNGEKKEFWLSRTNYTNLRELREIIKKYGKLEGVMVKIKRISKNDPQMSSLQIMDLSK